MTASVSVIIPVKNGARFIADAIESVRAQQVPDLEILVADDGSTDGTPSIAAALGPDVQVITPERRGVSAARNAGFAASSGAIVLFLDADDLLPAGTIPAYLDYFAAHPDTEIVGGYMQLITLLGAEGQVAHAPNMVRNMPIITLQIGVMAYRRALVERVGGFDESLPLSEDVDWHLRADELGVRRAFLHRVTLHYRRHPRNVTTGSALGLIRQSYYTVLRRAAERRGDPDLLQRLYPDWEGLRVSPPDSPLRISVIMAIGPSEADEAHNALASIAAQTRLPDEILLVTALPDGPLLAALGGLAERARVIQCDALGAAAWNVGVAAASGDALACLRPVDRWHPEFLATQHDAMRAEPVALYRAAGFGRFTTTAEPDPGLPTIIDTLSTLLIRREAFARVGMFDPAYPLAYDHDWVTRAEDAAVPFHRLHVVLAAVRAYDAAQQAAQNREILFIRRASLTRRAPERKYHPT